MKEAASARPIGSRLGEVVFNAVAAALAFALLMATGRHLFGAMPDMTRPEPPPVAVAGAPDAGAPARAALPLTPLTPRAAAPLRARAMPPLPARGAVRKAPPPSTPLLKRASLRAAGVRPAGRPKNRVAPQARRPLVAAVTAPRSRPAQRSERAVPERRKTAPAGVGQARPRGVAARPNPSVHAMAPRPVAIVRTAPSRSLVALRGTSIRSSASLPPTRAHSGSAHAVIEPPLGYDPAPTLLVVPAAATIDFGSETLPAIRSRRRH